MPIDQKILDKLQKLLALSASENANEAILAMEKAQELMNEHHLSVLDVAEDGSNTDIREEQVWGMTKSRQKWEAGLGHEIARAFDGRAIISPTEEGWYMTFIAAKTDIAIIVDLFDRLRTTIRRMSRDYVKANTPDAPWPSPITLHNSYRMGMVATIRKRLKTLQENTRPDAQHTNQYGLTGQDLVVIKNQAVDERVNTKFGRGLRRESSSKTRVFASAYRQGKEDGDSVSLHRSVDNKGPDMITM